MDRKALKDGRRAMQTLEAYARIKRLADAMRDFDEIAPMLNHSKVLTESEWQYFGSTFAGVYELERKAREDILRGKDPEIISK